VWYVDYPLNPQDCMSSHERKMDVHKLIYRLCAGSSAQDDFLESRTAKVWIDHKFEHENGAERSLYSRSRSDPIKGRPPTTVDLVSLQPLFNMSEQEAARKLGISLTSLRLTCQRLGVRQWLISNRVSSLKKSRSSEITLHGSNMTVQTPRRSSLSSGAAFYSHVIARNNSHHAAQNATRINPQSVLLSDCLSADSSAQDDLLESKTRPVMKVTKVMKVPVGVKVSDKNCLTQFSYSRSRSDPIKGRPPTTVDLVSLHPLFSLPEQEAARKLGISLNSLRLTCQRLGVRQWLISPSSNKKFRSSEIISDVQSVQTLRRISISSPEPRRSSLSSGTAFYSHVIARNDSHQAVKKATQTNPQSLSLSAGHEAPYPKWKRVNVGDFRLASLVSAFLSIGMNLLLIIFAGLHMCMNMITVLAQLCYSSQPPWSVPSPPPLQRQAQSQRRQSTGLTERRQSTQNTWACEALSLDRDSM